MVQRFFVSLAAQLCCLAAQLCCLASGTYVAHNVAHGGFLKHNAVLESQFNLHAVEPDPYYLPCCGGVRHYKTPGGGYIKDPSSHAKNGKSSEPSARHDLVGAIVFILFGLGLCFGVAVVRKERIFFLSHVAGNHSSFRAYLKYRFSDWFVSKDYAPPVVLLFLTLALLVLSAILYALLVGGSPSQALYKAFVWSSASAADQEVTLWGRMLGVFCTVGGLVILSLLLSIMSSVFSSTIAKIANGGMNVIEGRHTLLLGYSDAGAALISELCIAKEHTGGGVIVWLTDRPKSDIEDEMHRAHIDMRGSRLLVRTGNVGFRRDLHQVAASTAGQIVVLANSYVSAESADMECMRCLLALKARGWPLQGHITVQCSCDTNMSALRHIYGSKAEVVAHADILGKFLVQFAFKKGLSQGLYEILGFEGDEFYINCWPGAVGKTFFDTVYCFPKAVVCGVFTAKDECIINPGWGYVIKNGDRLIVIAEDDDSYTFVDTPYFACPRWNSPRFNNSPCNTPRRHFLQSLEEPYESPVEILIVGWNSKVPAMLSMLQTELKHGSTVLCYSRHTITERKSLLDDMELEGDICLDGLTINHVFVEPERYTTHVELEKLSHQDFAQVFMVADALSESKIDADKITLAILTHMEHLYKLQGKEIMPVVEMCLPSAADDLRICGLSQSILSDSLVAMCLAAVMEDPAVNQIYNDLMGKGSNVIDVCDLQLFLPAGAPLPDKICFGEIVRLCSQAGDITVVGWSSTFDTRRGSVVETPRMLSAHPDAPDTAKAANTPRHSQPKWVVNPKDKCSQRKWTLDDKLLVFRRIRLEDAKPNSPALEDKHSELASCDSSRTSANDD